MVQINVNKQIGLSKRSFDIRRHTSRETQNIAEFYDDILRAKPGGLPALPVLKRILQPRDRCRASVI